MNAREQIRALKFALFDEAYAAALPVLTAQGQRVGSLVPVGQWMLSNEQVAYSMCAWRDPALRAGMLQFASAFEGALDVVDKSAIAQPDRLFFLIYDEQHRFVGHIGLADVADGGGEIDNLQRGIGGGDPRLIYFSELALLHWCYAALALTRIRLHVLPQNWMVIALHEEVGFVAGEQFALLTGEQDGHITHAWTAPDAAGALPLYTRMALAREDFYARAPWLPVR